VTQQADELTVIFPTAEFGIISAETACWENNQILMRTFTCRSTFLYGLIVLSLSLSQLSTFLCGKFIHLSAKLLSYIKKQG
jgi:hypothetical protein